MPTNFLLAPGTSGFIASVFNLLSTELNSLSNGAAATSSVGGTSGVFSQTDTANGMFGSVFFTAGGSFTPTAGGFLAGWFRLSTDGGTTFEDLLATPSTTVPAFPRAPDFTIPVYQGGTAYSSSKISWCQGRRVPLPWESFKVTLQNLSGAALPSSGNLLKMGPVAVQF